MTVKLKVFIDEIMATNRGLAAARIDARAFKDVVMPACSPRGKGGAANIKKKNKNKKGSQFLKKNFSNFKLILFFCSFLLLLLFVLPWRSKWSAAP